MLFAGLCLLGVTLMGCGDSQSDGISGSGAKLAKTQQNDGQQQSSEHPQETDSVDGSSVQTGDKRRSFKKVQLGAAEQSGSSGKDSATHSESLNVHVHDEERVDEVVKAMQPLQVVLGSWQGITNKSFEGFKSVAEVNWVWDFQTDKDQPALVMTSEQSPYVRKGRLTYLLEEQMFQFTTEERDGIKLEYRGTFSVAPKDVPGDDKKLQRTYKLQLTQVTGDDEKEAWRIVFSQQENDRYLMELSLSRNGGEFHRRDTVGTQRQGTSFAISDTDNKENACIISGGLGISQVTHNGISYWVCCSGCKAAFEDEPKRWIAKLDAREQAKVVE